MKKRRKAAKIAESAQNDAFTAMRRASCPTQRNAAIMRSYASKMFDLRQNAQNSTIGCPPSQRSATGFALHGPSLGRQKAGKWLDIAANCEEDRQKSEKVSMFSGFLPNTFEPCEDPSHSGCRVDESRIKLAENCLKVAKSSLSPENRNVCSGHSRQPLVAELGA